MPPPRRSDHHDARLSLWMGLLFGLLMWGLIAFGVIQPMFWPGGVIERSPGSRRFMPALAEHVCQSCGKRTWGDVPKRTDTMPACECGGRRQIVRIRHTAQHLQGPGLSAAERALD
jgi:hypothetical protein